MEAPAEKGHEEPYREQKASVDRGSGSAGRGQLGDDDVTSGLSLLYLDAVKYLFTLLLMVVVDLSSLFCCDSLY